MKSTILACIFFILASLLLRIEAGTIPQCDWQYIAPNVQDKIISVISSYSNGVKKDTLKTIINRSPNKNYSVSVHFKNDQDKEYELVGISYQAPKPFAHRLANNHYNSYCFSKNAGSRWVELVELQSNSVVASIPGRYFNISKDL